MPIFFSIKKQVNFEEMPKQEEKENISEDSDCEIISKPGLEKSQRLQLKPVSASNSNLMIDLTTTDGLSVIAGDMHANLIKLLYLLLSYKIISQVSDETYYAFFTIYKKNAWEITQEDIDVFKRQLDQLQFSSVTDVISLGDLFADRGNNDFWILLTLKKLIQANVTIELLLSNHDFELIKSYETKERFEPDSFMTGGFSRSLEQMQILIDRKLITQTEVLELIETVFQPILKILSYSLDATKTNITIYSHAPIDLQIINQMAQFFHIPYKSHTAIALAHTIELIQKSFVPYIQQNKIHQLCFVSDENPFFLVMQNRDFQKLTSLTSPNYCINYIHGHTMEKSIFSELSSEQSNVMINLNSTLGMPDINQGVLELVVKRKSNHRKLVPEDVLVDDYLFDAPKKDPVTRYLSDSSNSLRFFNGTDEVAPPQAKRGRFDDPEVINRSLS